MELIFALMIVGASGTVTEAAHFATQAECERSLTRLKSESFCVSKPKPNLERDLKSAAEMMQRMLKSLENQ